MGRPCHLGADMPIMFGIEGGNPYLYYCQLTVHRLHIYKSLFPRNRKWIRCCPLRYLPRFNAVSQMRAHEMCFVRRK